MAKETAPNRQYTDEFKLEALRLAGSVGINQAASGWGCRHRVWGTGCGSSGPADWLYLACVLDLVSRRAVGWSISDRMKAKLVCDAQTMAYWRRKPPA